MTLRAVTEKQPWASLFAYGVKTLLDRDEPAPEDLIGQTLLVHADDVEPDEQKVGDWYAYRNVFGKWELSHYAQGCTGAPESPVPLPLGAVVASCRVVASVPVVDRRHLRFHHPVGDLVSINQATGTIRLWAADGMRDLSDQLPYGRYEPERWCWVIEDVAPVTDRCPRCWGEGLVEREGVEPSFSVPATCPTCKGAGRLSEPIACKGHPGLWTLPDDVVTR